MKMRELILALIFLLAAALPAFCQTEEEPAGTQAFDLQRLEEVERQSLTDLLEETNGRDLFAPPAEEEKPAGEEVRKVPEKEEPLNIFYRGHLSLNGERQALLERLSESGEKKSFFLKKGDKLDGYQVLEVSSASVRLSGPDGEELEISFSREEEAPAETETSEQ